MENESIKITLLNIVKHPSHKIEIRHRLAILYCTGSQFVNVTASTGDVIIKDAVLWRFSDEPSRILIAVPDVTKPAKALIEIDTGQSLEVETGQVEPFNVLLMPTAHLCFGYFVGLPEHIETGHLVAEAVNLVRNTYGYRYNIEFTRAISNFLDKYPVETAHVRDLYGQNLITVSPYWTPSVFEAYDAEAHIRQLAEAQWWLRENLGKESHVAMGCDTSGFDPQQPQIFKQCGVDFFFRSRYTIYEKQKGSPFIVHMGADGSSMQCFVSRNPISLVYISPPIAEMWTDYMFVDLTAGNKGKDTYVYGYGSKVRNIGQITESLAKYIADAQIICGVNFNVHFAGMDMTSAEPTIKIVENWNKEYITPYLSFNSTDEAASALLNSREFIRDEQEGEQPHWGQIGVGFRLTIPFQQASYALVEAEKAATLDLLINSTPYPERELHTGWMNILDEQHHEQVGNAAEEAISNAGDLIRRTLIAAKDITRCSLERIANKIHFTERGCPVVVFNLLNWIRRDIVEFNTNFSEASVVDTNGNHVPCEISDSGIVRFLAEVDGMGYRTYYIKNQSPKHLEQKEENRTVSMVENQYFLLEVDSDTGCVTNLFDKELGIAVMKAGGTRYPLELEVNEDSGEGYCTFWPSGRTWRSSQIGGARVKCTRTDLSAKIIVERPLLSEQGDVKVGTILRIEYELPFGIKRFDVTITTHWDSEPGRELRLVIPFALKSPRIFYDTLLSTSKYDEDLPRRQNLYMRKEFKDEKGELYFTEEGQRYFDYRMPCRFVSIYESQRDIGITLTVPNGMMRVEHGGVSFSLIEDRTSSYREWIPSMKGQHKFHLSFTSHHGDWKTAKAWRLGWERRSRFNDMVAVSPSRFYPFIPEQGKLLEYKGENLVLTALKKSHVGEDIIVRVYDASGDGDVLSLKLPVSYLGAYPFELGQVWHGEVSTISKRERKPLSLCRAALTDLLENTCAEVKIDELQNTGVNVGPYKIQTIRMEFEEPRQSWIPTRDLAK